MMKRLITLMLLSSVACTGSLTKEQRENIRENMKNGAIQKVSEAQILDGAYALGRAVMTSYQADLNAKGNLETTHHVKIAELVPGQPGLGAKEKELLDAYVAGAAEGRVGDNVQKLGADTILYTKAITRERPDGSLEFLKAVGIRMPVKEIILSIQE
jgi:hypothetical protein